MRNRETVWNADDAKYREFCDRIISLKKEQKDLGQDIISARNNATAEGCNPRVLSAMVKLALMKQAEKDALEEAMEK